MRYDFVAKSRPNLDALVMQRPERRPVTHRDNRGIRQSRAQKCVYPTLGGLVQRCRGLIKKKPIRLEENGANDGQALLLAERKFLLPVGMVVETTSEC